MHINGKQAVHFTMPDGTNLPEGPDGRSRGNVVAIETTNRKNGLEITPKTAITQWCGEEMDRDMAVDALYRCESRSKADPVDD